MEPQPAVDPTERLTIDVAPHPGGTVVKVDGELDHDTAPQFLLTLDQALARNTGPVVIDCAGITFCDSSGLNALLRARRTAMMLQRALVLAAPSRSIRRVLQLTGAEAALELVATVEAAFEV